jgi:hypothetical protein
MAMSEAISAACRRQCGCNGSGICLQIEVLLPHVVSASSYGHTSKFVSTPAEYSLVCEINSLK